MMHALANATQCTTPQHAHAQFVIKNHAPARDTFHTGWYNMDDIHLYLRHGGSGMQLVHGATHFGMSQHVTWDHTLSLQHNHQHIDCAILLLHGKATSLQHDTRLHAVAAIKWKQNEQQVWLLIDSENPNHVTPLSTVATQFDAHILLPIGHGQPAWPLNRRQCREKLQPLARHQAEMHTTMHTTLSYPGCPTTVWDGWVRPAAKILLFGHDLLTASGQHMMRVCKGSGLQILSHAQYAKQTSKDNTATQTNNPHLLLTIHNQTHLRLLQEIP